MIDPCTLVIFGATGNLAEIKLMPALYQLEVHNRLPDGMVILGTARRELSRQEWVDEVSRMLHKKNPNGLNQAAFERFCTRLHYHVNDLGDDAAYEGMKELLNNSNFPNNAAFYMAIRPADFSMVIDKLGQRGLLEERGGWRRVVIEKPFGFDLLSAQTLQKGLSRHLTENQIYRIDHYLGKGTVQNVLVFRFANIMLEPLWNRHYIDHVQISHSEQIGLDTRGAFYEGAGALRDMIQSHLLQLLTLVAMEPPVMMEAESLRDEKVKVLKSIRAIPQHAVHAHAFRAQYTRGMINGESVKGYLEEKGVAENSTTETYAALKLYIDNWRWKGVPFYLRTGKRLAKGASMICIRFKYPPHHLFKTTHIEQLHANWLLVGIQPNESMRIEMQVKEPGLEMRTRIVSLDASYRRQDERAGDAYEDLLLDVMEGDHSLFLRYDEIEWAWRVVDPIIKVWSMERDFINTYPAGSWGPRGTYRLFDREDQFWRHSLDIEGNDVTANVY